MKGTGMKSTAGHLEGRCLCGAVTIHVDGGYEPLPGACHCRMCQRWSGALFLCFRADAAAVMVEGPVRRFGSSALAERVFCPSCGTHLWMRDVEDDAPYDLVAGLFDDARDWPLSSEIYTDCAMASIRLGGEHARLTAAEYEAEHPHADPQG